MKALDRQNLIGNIAASRSTFPASIDYIRFPYFRNIEENTKIEFESPFTVFVGQNGCGKSSVLQALFGAPKGNSLGRYWFSTVIDPITEPDANHRHCFIYSYSQFGPTREVLKTRIFKENQPDLFDTSPAIGAYGMSNPDKRTLKPIDKKVVYLNFRAAQNAFEKKFNEERPPAHGVQNFLRAKSIYLEKTIKGTFKDSRFKGRTQEFIVDFTQDQLNIAEYILGRKYETVKLIKHRFFDIWGHSVIMSTDSAKYSEAFAGSGEFAVLLLIYEITTATPGTLVLLDEPETSLHPGAQRNLQTFLLAECLNKKHHVVICSHSPALVEGLPEKWIKVFYRAESGKFAVTEKSLPEEAFYFIGEPLLNKFRIHVEDRLAKSVVDSVLHQTGAQTKSLFDVTFNPGGESALKKDAIVYSRETPCRNHIIFDKDVQPSTTFEDPDDLPFKIHSNAKKASIHYAKELESRGFNGLKFASDGGTGGTKIEQQKQGMAIYIKYASRCIEYFPFDLEDMLWDDELAEMLIASTLGDSQDHMERLSQMRPKQKFAKLATQLYGISSEAVGSQIDVLHSQFLKRWIKKKGEGYEEILQIVENLRQKIAAH